MSQFPFLPPEDNEAPPGQLNLQEMAAAAQSVEAERKDKELLGLRPDAQLHYGRRK